MIEFRNLTKKKINKRPFKKLYKKIFAGRMAKTMDLSVVFAKPELMRTINKNFCKKNVPANVLSFALKKGCLGEIFLNTKEKNLPILFIHGSLHILGYNHQKQRDADIMNIKEKQFKKCRLNLDQ